MPDQRKFEDGKQLYDQIMFNRKKVRNQLEFAKIKAERTINGAWVDKWYDRNYNYVFVVPFVCGAMLSALVLELIIVALSFTVYPIIYIKTREDKENLEIRAIYQLIIKQEGQKAPRLSPQKVHDKIVQHVAHDVAEAAKKSKEEKQQAEEVKDFQKFKTNKPQKIPAPKKDPSTRSTNLSGSVSKMLADRPYKEKSTQNTLDGTAGTVADTSKKAVPSSFNEKEEGTQEIETESWKTAETSKSPLKTQDTETEAQTQTHELDVTVRSEYKPEDTTSKFDQSDLLSKDEAKSAMTTPDNNETEGNTEKKAENGKDEKSAK
ncbi:unnamed protein product [Bursaphelenchus xylophilus]|uniref:(pine wood nematode) hypothetical protein n=1 Tax=Bursaphelenchus xylophilus TaxID=6326 RepID=A0A1I7RJN2_BURXY|nr:unnamed protein product [Bursaphelenchus xylophilus]CAG9128963.1 unnamed protein product [Bursaphelenchus xylophilus]